MSTVARGGCGRVAVLKRTRGVSVRKRWRMTVCVVIASGRGPIGGEIAVRCEPVPRLEAVRRGARDRTSRLIAFLLCLCSFTQSPHAATRVA